MAMSRNRCGAGWGVFKAIQCRAGRDGLKVVRSRWDAGRIEVGF